MTISENGIALIKEFEGCRLTAYQDIVGVWTIGYGTTDADESLTGTKIYEGLTITQEQADEWLRYTIERKYAPLVMKYDHSYHWTQPELDALISFAYNIGGIGGLTKSGTRTRAEIAEVWPEYCHAGGKVVKGLQMRRAKELELFLSGAQTEEEDHVMSFDRTKVIELARAEEGYTEKSASHWKKYGVEGLYEKTAGAGSDNYTKYNYELHKLYPAVMDFPGPWCDSFIDNLFMQAYGVSNAKKLLAGDFDDYTVASAQLYKNKNAWRTAGTIPEPGWQIFFKNSVRICHTGLVLETVTSGGITYVITAEGNSGHAVRIKQYRADDPSIAGYGVPPYDDYEAAEKIDFTPHWIHSDGVWYYRIGEGKNAHGWRVINGHWYYFDDKGRMFTGRHKINDKVYYFATLEDSEAYEGACMITDTNGALHIWDLTAY